MRPFLEQHVSLARFRLKAGIRVVECQRTPEDYRRRLEGSPSADQLDQWIWNDIGHAFSRPVNRYDDPESYVPTQIIAELFKSEGFDGVRYESGLEKGANLVLFNRESATIVERYLYRTTKVSYAFAAEQPFGIPEEGHTIETEPPTHYG